MEASLKIEKLTPQQAMLKEVIAALCLRPAMLEVKFRPYDSNELVMIHAHPSDAKIIVGGGGAHLGALKHLAQLLWRGQRKLVQIMPIESDETIALLPYAPFKPTKDWPEDKMADLMMRLAQLVFPECRVNLQSIPENRMAQNFDVSLVPYPNQHAVKQFASAVAVLFIPIGTAHGRMIFANIKR